MLLISSRLNFTDPKVLANRHETRRMTLRGAGPPPNQGVVVAKPIDELAQLPRRRILMLVHGFANKNLNIYGAYTLFHDKIQSHFGDHYDEIIGYIWPSEEALGNTEYATAKSNAALLAPRLGDCLASMKAENLTVDLITHSMGARVVLGALATRTVPTVRNIFTFAAAIDHDSLEAGQPFHPALDTCETLFVFHSKFDKWLPNYPDLENNQPPRRIPALGLDGPSNRAAVADKMFIVNAQRPVLGHSKYRESDAVFAFLGGFLGGTVPGQFSEL